MRDSVANAWPKLAGGAHSSKSSALVYLPGVTMRSLDVPSSRLGRAICVPHSRTFCVPLVRVTIVCACAEVRPLAPPVATLLEAVQASEGGLSAAVCAVACSYVVPVNLWR